MSALVRRSERFIAQSKGLKPLLRNKRRVQSKIQIRAVENPVSYYIERFTKILGEPTAVGAAQK